MNYKEVFLQWRVILLLVFLVFALVSIFSLDYNNWGAEGATIRSIVPNSSASLAGVANPSPKLTPLAKERIISLDGKTVTSELDFYTYTQSLQENRTIRLTTTKGTYTLLTKRDNTSDSVELGITVYTSPTTNLRKGLDLEGGTRVLLQPVGEISAEDLDSTVESLKERLNVYGLSDVVVRPASDLTGEMYILIEIAGVTEEEVKELLSRQGKFEARVGENTVFFGGKKDITYVCRSAQCSGIDPQRGCSRAADGVVCGFFFSITLSPEAAERHAKITENLPVVTDETGSYLNESLILFLDDKEVDKLRIGADLKGRATTEIQISGSGVGRTEQEAVSNTLQSMKKLQTVLITGSLPVKLEVVKIDTISPTLGKEFLNNILLAGFFAVLAVGIVIGARYKNIKIIAPMILVLLSEMVLLLGFAAFVGWNLDLAAIAGIIIVAGTGVDHLIVITDETLKGQVVTDWKRRIKNAMFIIMGAFFITFSGMLPLLWAGAGLLKGFALTTIAGITLGVFIARPAYAAIIEKMLQE